MTLTTGRVEKVNSLFWYDNGTSYETLNDFDFQPTFVEDVLAAMTPDDREAADAACKNNTVCLFDFAVTGLSVSLIQLVVIVYNPSLTVNRVVNAVI